MPKIVVNRDYGGFGLSKTAAIRLKELGVGTSEDPWEYHDIDRTNTQLIRVVEELGELADGPHAKLEVIDIPENLNYYIHDYDGYETVREVHRVW